MYTEINGVRSECCLIKCGVLQGSIISPLLYLIYFNDIFNVCNLIKCVLYADYNILIISCDSIATLFSKESKYFAMISIWFSDNKLPLNTKKTRFILLATCNKLLNDCPNELHFDMLIVNLVDQVCYLCLTVDCNLSWKFHENCVNNKIARGVSLLKNFLILCLVNVYILYILLLFILIYNMALNFGV